MSIGTPAHSGQLFFFLSVCVVWLFKREKIRLHDSNTLGLLDREIFSTQKVKHTGVCVLVGVIDLGFFVLNRRASSL